MKTLEQYNKKLERLEKAIEDAKTLGYGLGIDYQCGMLEIARQAIISASVTEFDLDSFKLDKLG